jgi:ABC-type dipeptide/oligopeptide/nickel transport system permease subunit
VVAVRPTLNRWEEAQGVAARRSRRSTDALRRLSRNKVSLAGSIVALLYVVIGVIGPALAPHDYATQDLMATFKPPFSPDHLLGTDQLGRDVLSRLVVGIRISLLIGFGVTAVSLVIGTLAGALAGFYRGWIDTLISGLVELTWGFPLILIAVILTGALEPGLMAAVLAIGLINWAGFARIVRGEVLSLREREYIQASRSIGVGDFRLLVRHILPNVLGPALVMASYYVALAIIAEAGLSFIGMGAQPPLPSLGVMIADGRNYMLLDHWISTIPGLAIILVVMGLNLLGDGLRDAFDPRLTNG